jgi:hypothetical protein
MPSRNVERHQRAQVWISECGNQFLGFFLNQNGDQDRLAMASTDNLWWTSNGAVQALLQSEEVDASGKKQIDGHYEWILSGTTNFQVPSEGSKRAVADNKTVTFKGKKFGIEPLLRPATMKLSVLLVCVARLVFKSLAKCCISHVGSR